MKQIKIIIIGLIITLLITFAFDQINDQEIVIGEKEIQPYPSTFTLEASIYYIGDEGLLEPENKTLIVQNNRLVEAIVEALKQQPSLPNCQSAMAEDVRVLSAKMVNNKLYLNLNRAFVRSENWTGDQRVLTLYALVNSITQFDTIDRVQLRVEGENIEKYARDDNFYTDLTYNDAVTNRQSDSPEQVVLKFLNLISLRRFDLAYEMLEDYQLVDREAFISEMATYYQAKKSYEISRPFSRRNGSVINVTVPYQFYDKIRNITYDGGSEIWQLREAGKENYRIIWPRGN